MKRIKKKVNPWEAAFTAVLIIFSIIGAILLTLTFSEGRRD